MELRIHAPHLDEVYHSRNWYIKAICLCFSLSLLAACPIAASYFHFWADLIPGWIRILSSPCPLVTDYFDLGNIASAFLNAGVCGLACTMIMILFKVHCDVNTLAGYFLVIAHCFYGLNFLNMWPPMLGILAFCINYKVDFRSNMGMAMYSTAFGPFISELLFRYHLDDHFIFSFVNVHIVNLVYVIGFSAFLGFAIPAMLPGAMRLHKGFNLYNGGLAFGLLGLFLYSFMYNTFGVEPHSPVFIYNPVYNDFGRSYMGFMVIYFMIVFLFFLLWGWYENGKSFRGYLRILRSSGYNADYFEQYSASHVLMNIGIYGIMMLAYFSFVVMCSDGAGFTGATAGVILASLTFTSKGQHPNNVWPILLGFITLSFTVSCICLAGGRPIPWTLSTQAYMNGVAFATGLCPIAGHYGRRFGIIAGFICAVICTSTNRMHGGLMLYNGGLSAGITALILVPFLKYYWKGNPRKSE